LGVSDLSDKNVFEITVEFIVESDGSITGVSLIKGADATLAQKIGRALKKMPAWRPGYKDGMAVNVLVIQPLVNLMEPGLYHGPDSSNAEQIYENPDEKPSPLFNLGDYVGHHLRYPEKARDEGLQGKVLVKFVVNADGTYEGVELEKTSGFEVLDKEALRVIEKMPDRWKPGTNKGKKVRAVYHDVVTFKLE